MSFRLAIFALALAFLLTAAARGPRDEGGVVMGYQDRVVISAPVLLFLTFGDRYLAGNLEVMRLSATSGGGGHTHYLSRAQVEAARLHPCHEDNYYLANGLLAWSGAVESGNRVLRSAMECRTWDGVPGFLYGVNKFFFDKDIDEAEKALEVSARRWPENAALLRKLAIMLRADGFADEQLALDYLRRQRDGARDSGLRSMLDKRVVRLEGLLTLREAQRAHEKSHGDLRELQDLVSHGFLSEIPVDPLNLGYELKDNIIVLKRIQLVGLEARN